jgi:hypothetical protein
MGGLPLEFNACEWIKNRLFGIRSGAVKCNEITLKGPEINNWGYFSVLKQLLIGSVGRI